MSEVKTQKIRFQNVDFLRFLFIIFIVMFHYNNSCERLFSNTYLHGIPNLCVCVDFFFIIAGFFLFNNIKLEMKTFDFMKKRFLRLAPLSWVFILIAMICSFIIPHWKFSFDGNILRIFLLNNISLAPRTTGGIGMVSSWFISVLFWVSVFYFYISKILKKKYLNLIIWTIIICSLGCYLNERNFSVGGESKVIYGFMNIGVLRGLYGMGIGYFISMLWNKNFLKNINNKWLFSIAEFLTAGFLIYYLIFSKSLPGKSAFVYIFVFSILFYLFLIKKGVLSNLLENKYCAGLGTYSYSIYIMHPIIDIMFNLTILSHNREYVQNHWLYIYPVYVLSGVVFGILCHYIFEKPINKYIGKVTK